jgi:hypothetical protein
MSAAWWERPRASGILLLQISMLSIVIQRLKIYLKKKKGSREIPFTTVNSFLNSSEKD